MRKNACVASDTLHSPGQDTETHSHLRKSAKWIKKGCTDGKELIPLQDYFTYAFPMKQCILALQAVFILVASAACSHSRVAGKLDRAEALTETDPDSAITELRSIRPEDIDSKEEKARYALLLTDALVQTGQNIASDSLIDSAIAYYSHHGNSEKLMKALFCKGSANYRKGDLNAAIIPAMQARELAIDADDDNWHARTAELIGGIFTYSQNKNEAVKYIREAADYFQKAGKTTEHRFALCDIAIARSDKDNGYSADIALLDSVRSLAKANPADSALLAYCDQALVPMYLNTDRNAEAALALDELSALRIRNISESRINAYKARLALNLDDNAMAVRELTAADSLARNTSDRIWVYADNVKLYKSEGRFKEALAYTDSILNVQNREIAKVINQSVVCSQRDYFCHKAGQEAMKAARLKIMLAAGSIAAIILIIFLIYRHRMKLKVKKAEIDVRMNEILLLTEGMQKKDVEISSLTESFNETIERQQSEIRKLDETVSLSEAQKSETETRIESLFKEQWRFLNLLCNDYFEKGDSPKARTDIIHNIEKEIQKLRKPANIRNIEKAVDECMGRIASRLRQECPFLKEQDITFITLLYAGFSPRAVCIFTDIKLKYYYNKKKRLADRIEASDAPGKALFISKMG